MTSLLTGKIQLNNKVYPYVLVCPYEVQKGKPYCFMKIPAEIVQYKCKLCQKSSTHVCMCNKWSKERLWKIIWHAPLLVTVCYHYTRYFTMTLMNELLLRCFAPTLCQGPKVKGKLIRWRQDRSYCEARGKLPPFWTSLPYNEPEKIKFIREKIIAIIRFDFSMRI